MHNKKRFYFVIGVIFLECSYADEIFLLYVCILPVGLCSFIGKFGDLSYEKTKGPNCSLQLCPFAFVY